MGEGGRSKSVARERNPVKQRSFVFLGFSVLEDRGRCARQSREGKIIIVIAQYMNLLFLRIIVCAAIT
ncbi:hypothetical protein HBI46_242440 [Parastagonospora nodorum]|nr:hypothetical protein HBI46_242440 [Parastagonospora nodorum]